MNNDMKTSDVQSGNEASPQMGSGLCGLKEQLTSMENALNNLKKVTSTGTCNNQSSENQNKELNQGQQVAQELQKKIQDFRCRAQEQQKQTEKQLENAINGAIAALTEASQQLKSHQILTQMNGFIEQSQQQLNQMSNQGQEKEGSESDKQQDNRQNQQNQQNQQGKQDQQGKQGSQQNQDSKDSQFSEQQ